MSVGHTLVTETDGLPTFDLEFKYDDHDEPGAVTVFDSDAEEITTAWISAAVDDAVSLDQIA